MSWAHAARLKKRSWGGNALRCIFADHFIPCSRASFAFTASSIFCCRSASLFAAFALRSISLVALILFFCSVRLRGLSTIFLFFLPRILPRCLAGVAAFSSGASTYKPPGPATTFLKMIFLAFFMQGASLNALPMPLEGSNHVPEACRFRISALAAAFSWRVLFSSVGGGGRERERSVKNRGTRGTYSHKNAPSAIATNSAFDISFTFAAISMGEAGNVGNKVYAWVDASWPAGANLTFFLILGAVCMVPYHLNNR